MALTPAANGLSQGWLIRSPPSSYCCWMTAWWQKSALACREAGMQEQLKQWAQGSLLLGTSPDLQAGLVSACKSKPAAPMTLGPCEFSRKGCHTCPLLHTGLGMVLEATATTTALKQSYYSAATRHRWRHFLCNEQPPNLTPCPHHEPATS